MSPTLLKLVFFQVNVGPAILGVDVAACGAVVASMPLADGVAAAPAGPEGALPPSSSVRPVTTETRARILTNRVSSRARVSGRLLRRAGAGAAA